MHWARDGAEANAIVAGHRARPRQREVIKVKSLATDEIGLNEALELRGIRAVETDLAELIVQLAHDTPSHILVPAIHKNRAEIRALFERTIAQGQELGDEPRAIAEAARRHLREKFLTVPVAVSGANFGVAETGTICVVESEGNGRMCTTLPEVLVTVMGIEKVLPEWRDLEVMLQLLPRSSTAERMNPYTSLWTGVRDGDGPREFHLILLDAGRTDVLADEVGRQALRCIRCSACLNVCPVYARTGGHAYESVYPGPIGAILTPQLLGLESAPTLPWASTLCGACYEVCPVKIDIPHVLVHLRGRVVRESKRALDAPSGGHGRRRARVRQPRALRARTAAGAAAPRPAARAGRRRSAPGRPCATCPTCRAEPSATGGARERRASEGCRTGRRGSRADAALGRARVRPSARDEVLGGCAQRSARRVVPEVPRDTGAGERDGDAVERFCRARGDYRATVRRVAATDVETAVAEACAARGARRLAVPPACRREAPGVELVRDDRPSAPDELGALDGVLSGCALAIAETGTIVLDGGARSGRRAITLVPDYHVCVVEAAAIVAGVPDAVAALAEAAADGRPITFVSGPCATSDIELERVEGVHGPRTLDILVAG